MKEIESSLTVFFQNHRYQGKNSREENDCLNHFYYCYIMRKCFQDWKNYQERKDEEWYDLMDNFANQVDENNAINTRHKEEIKKALIYIKTFSKAKIKSMTLSRIRI